MSFMCGLPQFFASSAYKIYSLFGGGSVRAGRQGPFFLSDKVVRRKLPISVMSFIWLTWEWNRSCALLRRATTIARNGKSSRCIFLQPARGRIGDADVMRRWVKGKNGVLRTSRGNARWIKKIDETSWRELVPKNPVWCETRGEYVASKNSIEYDNHSYEKRQST